MVTVERFVEIHLSSNGYLGNCRTLFVAENYPNLKTYFYRTLSLNSKVVNPFFNNLTDALGLPPNPERLRLDNFLNNGYRLIDAFDSHKVMHPIVDIYNDIKLLNPKNIIFITENNENTIKSLTNYLIAIRDTSMLLKIVPDYHRAKMVHCFPSTQYGKDSVIKFNTSIGLGIELGLI